MSTAKALKKFKSMVSVAQSQVDKFKVELDKDPAYALSWGTGVFQSAARLKVAGMLVVAFEGECTVEQARATLLDRVMSKSRYPAQSTSPCSNLMEQYELAAYAEAMEDLQYL